MSSELIVMLLAPPADRPGRASDLPARALFKRRESSGPATKEADFSDVLLRRIRWARAPLPPAARVPLLDHRLSGVGLRRSLCSSSPWGAFVALRSSGAGHPAIPWGWVLISLGVLQGGRLAGTRRPLRHRGWLACSWWSCWALRLRRRREACSSSPFRGTKPRGPRR